MALGHLSRAVERGEAALELLAGHVTDRGRYGPVMTVRPALAGNRQHIRIVFRLPCQRSDRFDRKWKCSTRENVLK